MENISVMVRKDEFILNIVMAALSTGFSWSAVVEKGMYIQPLQWTRV
jgi:hypothetical protein